MGKAIQDLQNEHKSILFVLKILDKMLQSQKDSKALLAYYEEIIYFLNIFADKCHHGKEEKYLFKEILNKENPNLSAIISQMLEEHTQSREYLSKMSRSLENQEIGEFNKYAALYRGLLRRHIKKEEEELFIPADKLLDEKEQNLLFELFEDHEEKAIGHGIHEKLHAMIDTWEEAFTPE